jgi:hypothetical protein
MHRNGPPRRSRSCWLTPMRPLPGKSCGRARRRRAGVAAGRTRRLSRLTR